MTVVADLHVHTNASDGLMAPGDVVRLAESAGLTAIAVTDHDTVGGIEEALTAADSLQLQVIPGIELSSEYAGTEIHILGYFIDYTYLPLQTLLQRLHESRFGRAEIIVEKLKKIGYNIEYESVMRQAGTAAPGRPHIARALVEYGYFRTATEVFEKLLSPNMPGYVERYKLTPVEAIHMIREAGGFASWAHPSLSEADHLLESFVRQGLHGLEVYHHEHGREQINRYKKLAEQYGLMVTGGSDFHGSGAGHARDLAFCGLNQQEFCVFLKQTQRTC